VLDSMCSLTGSIALHGERIPHPRRGPNTAKAPLTSPWSRTRPTAGGDALRQSTDPTSLAFARAVAFQAVALTQV
jgi:hypothetical protein